MQIHANSVLIKIKHNFTVDKLEALFKWARASGLNETPFWPLKSASGSVENEWGSSSRESHMATIFYLVKKIMRLIKMCRWNISSLILPWNCLEDLS